MANLPDEILLRIARYLYGPVTARFASLNGSFSGLCYSNAKVYLGSFQDLIDLKWCLDNNLIDRKLQVLVISHITRCITPELKALVSTLHATNLVFNDDWQYLQSLSYDHLILSNIRILCDRKIDETLEKSPATLELNGHVPYNIISRLIPKLYRTYMVSHHDIFVTISSRSINVSVPIPFKAWHGSTNITESVMDQVELYLNSKPLIVVYIASLNPMMCWQCDRYGVPENRHIWVLSDFIHIYPKIQSILVYSLECVLEFSSDISQSNMSRVSEIYVQHSSQVEPIVIAKMILLMYPSIQSIYQLVHDGHLLLMERS